MLLVVGTRSFFLGDRFLCQVAPAAIEISAAACRAVIHSSLAGTEIRGPCARLAVGSSLMPRKPYGARAE
jgi:hypothetical protein